MGRLLTGRRNLVPIPEKVNWIHREESHIPGFARAGVLGRVYVILNREHALDSCLVAFSLRAEGAQQKGAGFARTNRFPLRRKMLWSGCARHRRGWARVREDFEEA